MARPASQADHLDRVGARIGELIREFFAAPDRETFHAEELRTFIRGAAGRVAPGSPDRVMRDLRRRGLIDYELLSRRDSCYRVRRGPEVPAAAPAAE